MGVPPDEPRSPKRRLVAFEDSTAVLQPSQAGNAPEGGSEQSQVAEAAKPMNIDPPEMAEEAQDEDITSREGDPETQPPQGVLPAPQQGQVRVPVPGTMPKGELFELRRKQYIRKGKAIARKKKRGTQRKQQAVELPLELMDFVNVDFRGFGC